MSSQYAQYSLAVPSAHGAAEATGQAAHGPAPPVADDPRAEVHITPGQQVPANIPDGGLVEEKVEYRDEEGNLLDEEQVKALEGKVSFSTRYETRTKLVDEYGREVWEDEGTAGASADGVEPVSGHEAGEGEASTKPGKARVREDVDKEWSVVNEKATAEPPSDAGKPTKDEL
jgi:dolichyl-phosphate-mannose-protein mannosyltransferase